MADDIAGKLKSAAAWLFTQHGFTATRVADIVANAGVAQGTFYLHFENKPSLFVALNRASARVQNCARRSAGLRAIAQAVGEV